MKNLNYPHSWEERAPAFIDQVLFVPEYYEGHDQFGTPTLFENENPISLEYCSGNGEWIIEKALNNPHINWIAVEKKFKRVRKIWKKRQSAGLKNLVIVAGDARDFAKYYLKSGSIDAIYINFPDPWPKDKHAKHRLIQGEFVDEMKRSLKDASTITVVTDHPEYSFQVIDELKRAFEPSFEAPHYVEKDEAYGSSYFNRLWVEMGRLIRFIKFKKETCSSTI